MADEEGESSREIPDNFGNYGRNAGTFSYRSNLNSIIFGSAFQSRGNDEGNIKENLNNNNLNNNNNGFIDCQRVELAEIL